MSEINNGNTSALYIENMYKFVKIKALSGKQGNNIGLVPCGMLITRRVILLFRSFWGAIILCQHLIAIRFVYIQLKS